MSEYEINFENEAKSDNSTITDLIKTIVLLIIVFFTFIIKNE